MPADRQARRASLLVSEALRAEEPHFGDDPAPMVRARRIVLAVLAFAAITFVFAPRPVIGQAGAPIKAAVPPAGNLPGTRAFSHSPAKAITTRSSAANRVKRNLRACSTTPAFARTTTTRWRSIPPTSRWPSKCGPPPAASASHPCPTTRRRSRRAWSWASRPSARPRTP